MTRRIQTGELTALAHWGGSPEVACQTLRVTAKSHPAAIRLSHVFRALRRLVAEVGPELAFELTAGAIVRLVDAHGSLKYRHSPDEVDADAAPPDDFDISDDRCPRCGTAVFDGCDCPPAVVRMPRRNVRN